MPFMRDADSNIYQGPNLLRKVSQHASLPCPYYTPMLWVCFGNKLAVPPVDWQVSLFSVTWPNNSHQSTARQLCQLLNCSGCCPECLVWEKYQLQRHWGKQEVTLGWSGAYVTVCIEEGHYCETVLPLLSTVCACYLFESLEKQLMIDSQDEDLGGPSKLIMCIMQCNVA